MLKPESDQNVDTNKTPMAPTFDHTKSPDTVEKELEAFKGSPAPAPTPLEPVTTASTTPDSAHLEDGSSEKATQLTTPDPELRLEKTLELTKPEKPSEKPAEATDVKKTPVSSDILLPIMIYSVVKCNPTQLVSHILYIQRQRRHAAAGGEEGFCLINTMAVADFLENVDMDALGLTETDRVRYDKSRPTKREFEAEEHAIVLPISSPSRFQRMQRYSLPQPWKAIYPAAYVERSSKE